MNNTVTIGHPPWTREDMTDKLEEFASLYEKRPIRDNTGGMKTPHMFLAWFALQSLKPKAIIESGIWRGQGTWFFEQACSDAQLYCIDLNLNHVEYKSSRAEYFDRDFSTIDWNHLPKDETLLFIDDHQNAYERVKTAKWFGFRHLLFEDNYPASVGDCYSLKKVFTHAGLKSAPVPQQSTGIKFKQKINQALGIKNPSHHWEILPNSVDETYLRQNLEIYCELPPVFKPDKTRWNDTWSNELYPTPEPLLRSVQKEYQQIYFDEAVDYTWMCYVKLK